MLDSQTPCWLRLSITVLRCFRHDRVVNRNYSKDIDLSCRESSSRNSCSLLTIFGSLCCPMARVAAVLLVPGIVLASKATGHHLDKKYPFRTPLFCLRDSLKCHSISMISLIFFPPQYKTHGIVYEHIYIHIYIYIYIYMRYFIKKIHVCI